MAGAGGAIGVQKLMRAVPDGHTLIYGGLSESMLVPMINKTVNYRPEDLLPVALVGSEPTGAFARILLVPLFALFWLLINGSCSCGRCGKTLTARSVPGAQGRSCGHCALEI